MTQVYPDLFAESSDPARRITLLTRRKHPRPPSAPRAGRGGYDYWVFSDLRFQLASGPDEVLLGFLAQMVHPVVQQDPQRAKEIVDSPPPRTLFEADPRPR